jgi:hypothetical protein
MQRSMMCQLGHVGKLVRGQRSEDRGQRSEDRDQKSELGDQLFDSHRQQSEAPRPQIADLGSLSSDL